MKKRKTARRLPAPTLYEIEGMRRLLRAHYSPKLVDALCALAKRGLRSTATQ